MCIINSLSTYAELPNLKDSVRVGCQAPYLKGLQPELNLESCSN